jgi:hypothetical protein
MAVMSAPSPPSQSAVDADASTSSETVPGFLILHVFAR